MAQALALAAHNRHIPPPNPAVGCVLVGVDGQVIGTGATQAVGQAHAEVMALRDAQARGADTRGATAYVTLEPCSHHGRTGPCCDALVAAGIVKVVASLADPNPRVSCQGFARLREAGVQVEIGQGAQEARALNIGFFSRMVRGSPWVRMKIAASLDGRTALDNGQSQWITDSLARADGHAWRARACAVLTGIGTVLEDNPRLDVRLFDTPRQPHLVVVDSKLETPLDAKLWTTQRRVYIYGADAPNERRLALEHKGATVVCLPGANGKVDLAAMLRDLGQREINEIHAEAGTKLNGSLVREGLVDEYLVYLAPVLLGQGRGMAALGPWESLDQATRLHYIDTAMVGQDLRIRAQSPQRDDF